MKKLIIEDNQMGMLRNLVQEKADYCDFLIEHSTLVVQQISYKVIKKVFCDLLDTLNSSEEYEEDNKKVKKI